MNMLDADLLDPAFLALEQLDARCLNTRAQKIFHISIAAT